MRTGTWRPNMVTGLALTAIVSGRPLECSSVTVRSRSLGGNPFLEQGALSTTATIVMAQQEPATKTITTPWADPERRLPRRGDWVSIDVSDTRGQEWPVLTGGRLDSIPGSLRTTEREVGVIDLVDDLSQPVRLRAQAATMPPIEGGGGNRRMNLTAEWVLDALGEQAGYPATPAAGFGTMLRCSMFGSVAPTHGTATQVSQASTPNTEPRATVMDGQRLIVRDLNVRYDVASGTASRTFRATWDTNPQVAGESCEVTFHNSPNNPQDGVLLRNGDDDVIRVYEVDNGTATQRVALPRNGIRRAELTVTAATGTQMTVMLKAGGDTATGTINMDTGWTASRIYVRGTGRAGALLVNPSGPIIEPRMRIRTARPTYLHAIPYIEGTFLTILSDITRTVCGVAWLATDGTLEWTGRRWLEIQPRTGMTFDTVGTWDDINWSDDSSAARSRVRLAYKNPAISIRNRALAPAYVASSATTMDVGDVEEMWIEPANQDQSWLMHESSIILDVGGGQGNSHLVGNWLGGCFIFDQPVDGVTERMASANELDVTYTWVDSFKPVCKVTFTLLSQPAGSRFEMRTTRYHKRAAQPLPQFSTRGLIDWRDTVAEWSTLGASGPSEEIDGSWWIGHHEESFGLWRDDLNSWATASWPTMTGVTVGYDPRLELGDKVVLRDQHITGLTLDLVVSGVEAAPFEDRMVLSGTITAASLAGVPVTPHAASWDRIVTKWRGA